MYHGTNWLLELIVFVAGLAEEAEHVFLVGLYSRLVEGVDVEHVAAYSAGELEEIDELAEDLLVDARQLDAKDGDATVGMGDDGALLGVVVDLGQRLWNQIVDSVKILLVGGDDDVLGRGFDAEDGLEHEALALLDVLTHGVEVGGEAKAVREDAFAFFALALAVELLPPFADVFEVGEEVDEHLDFLAFRIEKVANGGVEECRIGL